MRTPVRAMTDRARRVLKLRYEERLTIPEIGGLLGVTVHRARTLLRQAERSMYAEWRTP